MNTKFILSITAICLILFSCNSEDVTSGDIDQAQVKQSKISSVFQASPELGSRLIKSVEVELGVGSGMSFTRSEDANNQLKMILQDYDMFSQQIISSTEKGGKTLMVKSKTNDNEYISFYEDENNVILNIKKIEVVTEGDNIAVNFSKLDGTVYFSAGGNINDDNFAVLSFNKDIFGNLQTRSDSVGCSAAIMAASLPWTIGFGIVNPLAGAAASLVFWGMSEVMC